MDPFLKGVLQGSIPVVVLVGGTHHIVKKLRETKPVLYWGSIIASAGLAFAIVQGKIPAPFMNAETFESRTTRKGGKHDPTKTVRDGTFIYTDKVDGLQMDYDNQKVRKLGKDLRRQGVPLKIKTKNAENFEASGTKKPKLTPKQKQALDMMKYSYGVNKNEYAYVEVDNRGWKPHRTRQVQALLDKGLIEIDRAENRDYYGYIENYKAYIVKLTPLAWEYKYEDPFGKYTPGSMYQQDGDKMV